MKKILLVFATFLALPALTACNTIEGVGEDVEATGEAVSDTARDAQN